MSFKNCYKDILYTLTNFDNWLGTSAKIIDKCEDSSDEDITLYEFIPISAYSETYLYGDGGKSNCWPGELTWLPQLAPFHGIISYVFNTYIFNNQEEEWKIAERWKDSYDYDDDNIFE